MIKKAYTLAEILIVLTILGIVGTITISSVVKKQFEIQNKTKTKKAMAIYESLINNIIAETELRSDTALRNWAGNNENDCVNSTKYFKKAEGTGCRFKTTDGVWWDIDDILNPKIALKNQSDLDNDDNPTTFKLKAYFDNQGIIRVNDLQHALNNANLTDEEKEELKKLYAFINKDISENVKKEKIKKSVSQFADTANVYMVESEETSLRNMLGTNCSNISNYFKVKSQDGCNFVNSDGTYWQINESDGSFTVSDRKDNPTYTIKMGVCDDGTINCQSQYPQAYESANSEDDEISEQEKKEKIEKSVSQFADMANVYMAESEETSLRNMLGTNCSNISNYFKVKSQDGCNFVNSDGTYWQINESDGSFTVSDRKDNPTYTIKMGVCDDGTINCQSQYPQAYNLTYNRQ